MDLDEHYSGDDAWEKFVNVHLKTPLSGEKFCSTDFPELIDLPEDVERELVVAVSYLGLERTRFWLTERIPALNGLTPIDCIFESSSNTLRRRLREYLLRLPI